MDKPFVAQTERLPVSAGMEKKISWAKEWWDLHRDEVLSLQEICRQGERFKAAVEGSRRTAAETGLTEYCRRCGQRGGSCCGAGLERHYTDVLLLINLFLGVDLPDQRTDPEGCFFLGEKGCRLLARQVLCINYLCPDLTSETNEEYLRRLREVEREELSLLADLNERFLRLLKSGPSGKCS